MTPKFPHVVVQLTEHNGNAFMIIGRVKASMRRAGVPQADIDAYLNAVINGNYDNLLQVTMRTVTVE